MNRNLWIALGVGVAVLAALVGGVAAQSKAPPPPVAAPASAQAALGTAFTYQGQLKTSAGNPVNGNCSMQFGLWDSSTGGAQLGITQTVPVSVTNGLFSATLNDGAQFGASAFNGEARYLAIAVKCGSDAGYTGLGRQPLTAAPYARYASAAGSVPWSGVVGAPPTFYYPLLKPQSLNLATVDPNLTGFAGGFTDGRYGYLVPNYHGFHFGKVARVDLQSFSSTGVITLDLAAVDSDLKGFIGGFTDGRYGYFLPYETSSGNKSGKMARVDLQNFNPTGVITLDLAAVDSGLKGFQGGFTDGRYGYLVPCMNAAPSSYSGKVARVDLQNFGSTGVITLDLATVDPDLKGFEGGFTDGRYGYFVPGYNGAAFGKVARVDLQNFVTSTVTTLNLAAVDSGLKGFYGGFTDGRYGYFVPRNNLSYFGKVARVDLQDFSPTGVITLDLAAVDSGLTGFYGGFTDGRYGYFVPNYNGIYHGKVARVDLQNFRPSGVAWTDLAAVDSGLQGFQGGFTDGRYGYLVPGHDSSDYSGKVARIQLFSGNGAP